MFLIGDTPRDVECAKQAGVRSIAVATCPSFDANLLEQSNPELIVSNFEEDKEKLINFVLDY